MPRIEFTGSEPYYAKDGDAGADLLADQSLTIEPGKFALVRTGTSVALPPAVVGMVCSRSGLAAKHGVFVLNAPGIIDSGYRGEIGVVLYNAGDQPFEVNAGDRIAQLVMVRYVTADFVGVQELSETDRGASGFGSTGV